MWSFVLAGAKWFIPPREKSVEGQVCVITGAGSGLGRLFAQEFARRRATLVLWDINRESNEETAEMVREIYRETQPSAGELNSKHFPLFLVFHKRLLLLLFLGNIVQSTSLCSNTFVKVIHL